MRRAICVAVLGSLFLAASAFAADSEEQAIRFTINKAFENWAANKPDANDAYYAADVNAAWFDITPLQYTGWNAYKEGVKKVFADVESANLRIHDDVVVHRRGKVAWVTFTWTAELRMKSGKVEGGKARATEVLEKRGPQWMIVHEHVSFPAAM